MSSILDTCLFSFSLPLLCRSESASVLLVLLTLQEINSSPLPGVTLGYRIYEACGSNHLMRADLEAVNGAEQGFGSGSCGGSVEAVNGAEQGEQGEQGCGRGSCGGSMEAVLEQSLSGPCWALQVMEKKLALLFALVCIVNSLGNLLSSLSQGNIILLLFCC